MEKSSEYMNNERCLILFFSPWKYYFILIMNILVIGVNNICKSRRIQENDFF